MKNWKILILKEKIQFYNFNIGHKGHTIIEIFPLNQKKSFHPFVFCLFVFSTFHLSSVHFLNFFFFCVLKCYDVTDHCMISYGEIKCSLQKNLLLLTDARTRTEVETALCMLDMKVLILQCIAMKQHYACSLFNFRVFLYLELFIMKR